jgi:FMNH2-dependent dimethyl sulfone monooxygenase
MTALRRHPMLGLNRLKLGVFSMNTDGGLTLTRVPERWPALWSETVEVAQLADRAGLEFLLPIARWKGFGGEMNSREWSFETLTHAAGLAGVTERIGRPRASRSRTTIRDCSSRRQGARHARPYF